MNTIPKRNEYNNLEFLFIGGSLHGKFRMVDRNSEEVMAANFEKKNTIYVDAAEGDESGEELEIIDDTYIKRRITLNNLFTGSKTVDFFCIQGMGEGDARHYLEKLHKLVTIGV